MRIEAIRLWLRALFSRAHVESEMEKEMRLHLDMETEANIKKGMSPEEARRQAAIVFGGVARHQESARDERGTRGIEETIGDFRFAFRTLRKRPGFALLATLTLAIGIGATTGIYTMANWILLRPVPGVVDPKHLVVVSFEDGPGQTTGFSLAMLDHVRRSVSAFAGVMGTNTFSLQLGGEDVTARALEGAIVSTGYFDVLGVRPVRGRFFTEEELHPTNSAHVAVISWALWSSHFASDSAILGRTVRFNANDFTIVGVAPRTFHGVERLGNVDAWFPVSAYAALRHSNRDISRPNVRVLWTMVGRMNRGTSVNVAQAQISALVDQLLKSEPKTYAIHEENRPHVYEDVGTPVFGRNRTRGVFILLFGVVGVVLLIACANVANLLLLRGLSRRPEFAVRKALGASAFQLLRTHTTEGLVIGLIGGALGVAAALALTKIFEGQPIFRGQQFYVPGDVDQFAIDARVLAFVLLLSIATGLIFGLIPGLATLRGTKVVSLADAGRSASGGRGRFRAALVVLQVGGSVALIVVAALLGRTIEAIGKIDLGMDPTNVTAIQLDPSPQGYSLERRLALQSQLVNALRAEQGVENVALSAYGIPQRSFLSLNVRRGDAATDKWTAEVRESPVAPGYFATLRIPILAGRDFEPADADSASTAVMVNATTARQLFGAVNPVGRTLVLQSLTGPKTLQVVGVVADARGANVREPQGGVVYVPMRRGYETTIDIMVRSPRPFRDVDALMRRVVGETDRSIPLTPPTPVASIIETSVRAERLFLRLVALLGILAVILAAVGLYGVTAYAVTQRRREIGIRIALGAGVRTVIATVTRQTAIIVGIGMAAGVLAAAGFARALESMLFGVGRLDPISYVGGALLFALVSLIACIVPARSASLVNPTEALRAE